MRDHDPSHGRYVLDSQGNPVPEPDLLKWGLWMERAIKHRIVSQVQLENGVKVSTVFLGLDHNFCMIGPPLLWETMIFGGPHDQWQQRYSTREDALLGHLQAVELAQHGLHH